MAQPTVDQTECSISEFRTLMGSYPAGVSIVTAGTNDDPLMFGATVTAMCSLTDSPPTLLVSLFTGSPTLNAIEENGRFGINMLSNDQAHLAIRFGTRTKEKFITGEFERTSSGVPELFATVGFAECEVTKCVAIEDHTIVAGRIIATRQQARKPLIHLQKNFGEFHLPEIDRSERWILA